MEDENRMNRDTNAEKAQHVEAGISRVCSEKEEWNLTGTENSLNRLKQLSDKKYGKEKVTLKSLKPKCVCGSVRGIL